MTTARKPAAERQREIVEMTLRLPSVLDEGGVSTQTRAGHTGMTQAGLLRHVPTKNDLWIAVLSELERLHRHSWEGASREGDPAVVRLRKILLGRFKLVEEYPAVPALFFSNGRRATEEVVHPIHIRIMTALRLRIAEDLSLAAQERGRYIQIDTLDVESLLLGVVQDCLLRWSLTGRDFDLTAEGDRLIGLQLRLSGLEAGGDRS